MNDLEARTAIRRDLSRLGLNGQSVDMNCVGGDPTTRVDQIALHFDEMMAIAETDTMLAGLSIADDKASFVAWLHANEFACND